MRQARLEAPPGNRQQGGPCVTAADVGPLAATQVFRPEGGLGFLPGVRGGLSTEPDWPCVAAGDTASGVDVAVARAVSAADGLHVASA